MRQPTEAEVKEAKRYAEIFMLKAQSGAASSSDLATMAVGSMIGDALRLKLQDTDSFLFAQIVNRGMGLRGVTEAYDVLEKIFKDKDGTLTKLYGPQMTEALKRGAPIILGLFSLQIAKRAMELETFDDRLTALKKARPCIALEDY